MLAPLLASLLIHLRSLWTQFRVPLLGLAGLVLPWFVFVRLAREIWEGEGLPTGVC